MSTSLRERNRLAAMRTIQERALDLFDERGFDAVTIEEIAAEAGVSPSTIYRYFGTKEGLIVSDEFDMLSQEALDDLLDLDDPVGTVRAIVAGFESTASPLQTPNPSICMSLTFICLHLPPQRSVCRRGDTPRRSRSLPREARRELRLERPRALMRSISINPCTLR